MAGALWSGFPCRRCGVDAPTPSPLRDLGVPAPRMSTFVRAPRDFNLIGRLSRVTRKRTTLTRRHIDTSHPCSPRNLSQLVFRTSRDAASSEET